MKKLSVNIFEFAPPGQNNTFHGVKKSFYFIFSSIAVLTLTGCMASDHSASLAPKPPTPLLMDGAMGDYNTISVARGSAVSPDGTELSQLVSEGEAQAIALNADAADKSSCGFKDRFDRKAMLAYEWDRSRFSLDVDGIGLGGANVNNIRVEYKIRLQPEKPKKLRCRHNSKWQGLLGSGYNELIVREGVAVTQEVGRLKAKAKPYMDVFF